MRSFEIQIRLGGQRATKHRSCGPVIAGRHTRLSKCSVESVVWPLNLKTAQEKLHETPRLLQRSSRLPLGPSWIHLSTSWPELAWMSHSFGVWTREASCSLAFSFSFSMLLLLSSHPGVPTGVCVSMCVHTVRMQRCVVAHMRKPAQGYLYFLIFFIVFDMLSLSSRSRSWIISQMDTSDLLNICPFTAYPRAEETPVIVLAPFFTTWQCHTHKRKVVQNLVLMHIKYNFHLDTYCSLET